MNASQSATARPPAAAGGTLLSIQALRGVAAMLVVVFHAASFVAEHHGNTHEVFALGNAGVDIFFVISGFIMWKVTVRRPDGPGTFLLHRAIRLIPLYWFFTLLKALLAIALPWEFPHFTLAASDLLLSLAFVPHIAPGSMHAMPVLAQGWTLNFEVFFYLLFSLALMVPTHRRLWAIGLMLGAGAAAGLALAPAPVPAAGLLSPLLLEFLVGILIARLIGRNTPMPAWLCWGMVGAGGLLLLVADPAQFHDGARTWQYGIPAAMIVAGAVGAEMRGFFPSVPVLKRLGDASYSIYLTHTFTVSVLGKLWRPGWPGWAFVALAIVGSALVGVCVFRLIERPITDALRRETRRATTAPLVSKQAPSG